MQKERFKVATASYLILRDGDKVLLSKRENTGWMDGKYTMVSGHLEADETPVQAMIREAREEAGIEIEPKDLKMVHIGTRQRASENDNTYVDFYLECTRWRGEVTNMESDKCGGLEWFPASSLPAEILPYLSVVMTCVENGEMYSETDR